MRTLGRAGVSLYLGPLDEANTVLALDQVPGVLMEIAVVDKEVLPDKGGGAFDTWEDPQHCLTYLEVGQIGRNCLRMEDFQKLTNHR